MEKKISNYLTNNFIQQKKNNHLSTVSTVPLLTDSALPPETRTKKEKNIQQRSAVATVTLHLRH